MPRSTMRGLVSAAVVVLIAAACATPPAGGGGGGGGTSTTATGGGGAGGGGGDISNIDACSLLTPAEIEQALGAPIKPGKKETLSGNAAGCEWDSQEEAKAIAFYVKILPFDQAVWDLQIKGSGEESVPGIGDAAVRGFVGPGVILIKKGDREIDIQIVALYAPLQQVKDAQVTLATKLLSHL